MPMLTGTQLCKPLLLEIISRRESRYSNREDPSRPFGYKLLNFSIISMLRSWQLDRKWGRRRDFHPKLPIFVRSFSTETYVSILHSLHKYLAYGRLVEPILDAEAKNLASNTTPFVQEIDATGLISSYRMCHTHIGGEPDCHMSNCSKQMSRIRCCTSYASEKYGGRQAVVIN